ncbi:MAG: leucyl aminopeptidase [Bacteroidota bacterium]|nr:leucyl aminopeptidase [Bacteroidota bacterium]MDX5430496.1 leucyl aminopeptidase [Bacteroidota bacterium]MDX5469253.1 leucyl aminopeptidase [Bacteroidota bacterium]
MVKKNHKWEDLGLSAEEISFVKEQIKKEKSLISLGSLGKVKCLAIDLGEKDTIKRNEGFRKTGASFCAMVNAAGQKAARVIDLTDSQEDWFHLAEGLALANYQYLKYRKEAKKEKNSFEALAIQGKYASDEKLHELNCLVASVFWARDLVNEPVMSLDALKLAEEAELKGAEAGIKVEVLNKTKLEALKFGGLLAVNAGSQTPPTFTIMEYKPKKAINKQPIVLVGKGVVYDTGGLSLKPTASMDTMKCDMAGAAAVMAAIYGAASMKLPVHVVALIPATDNRPGEMAYTPGDVITMYNGSTVEVLNTDAEGRMILADALAYAKKYDPELVMDFATLTGAAAMAIGQYGIVCMGTADEKVKKSLKDSGDQVYERLVEFPIWDEYKELLKSDIADMKNIGGPVGGAITAGKFLEHFTDYPWMHFDIAGPAYIKGNDSYRGKNGTGSAVRFILNYLQKRAEK